MIILGNMVGGKNRREEREGHGRTSITMVNNKSPGPDGEWGIPVDVLFVRLNAFLNTHVLQVQFITATWIVSSLRERVFVNFVYQCIPYS